ncbi:inorganic phosphate transporter [Pararhizobium mangrovi]|uniref:Phosphate transporter n=1 Tax=Pararhizobium mangrovi TaxID=2590452 RepID=A0A506U0U2_9HYPH|nr:inorganic phosphate transporter [Pararhizobium mangrovi]TPW27390.1 inorganic phosphate transporter [Pararhizobium mangrovi]
MSQFSSETRKPTLDKDLDKFAYVEEATSFVSRSLVGPGIALIFLFTVAVFVAVIFSGTDRTLLIATAAAIGGYMALNIGANDVANNVGPAVGANALSMGGALVMAALCESAGALLAGGDVVQTISNGIVAPASLDGTSIFIQAMTAALVSSALWVNLATYVGAPVSTTHSVVGGVLGAGVAAAGLSAVHWEVVLAITASWIVSPLIGGVIAAAFLAFIKIFIIYRDDKIAAARRWVPVLIAVMAGAFASYLAYKGLGHLFHLGPADATVTGLVVGLAAWLVYNPLIRRQSRNLENRNQSLRKLFTVPLVVSAAFLSFAHGANDVANAVGPLAAIVGAAEAGSVGTAITIPIWVMVVGAFGISLGLTLFGPRLIRMVGRQITRLNPMRAFCVALSAALTVIVASWLGLPVSSTHIALGGVFGVGLFREWYTARSPRRMAYVRRNETRRAKAAPGPHAREEQRRRKLVRRSHFMRIVAAWIFTVPAAALLAAGVFFALTPFFAL